jgi:hypothetical protein
MVAAPCGDEAAGQACVKRLSSLISELDKTRRSPVRVASKHDDGIKGAHHSVFIQKVVATHLD